MRIGQSRQQGGTRCHLPDLTISSNFLVEPNQGEQTHSSTASVASSKRAGGLKQQRSSVQSQTSVVSSSSSVSLSSSGNSSASSSSKTFELPPVVKTTTAAAAFATNSTLVHLRAANRSTSVSDHLAAASARTGASLPLMIGNRSKCVVNLLDQEQDQQQQQQQPPPVLAPGPQNTALRAEQRRQNMSVSVVRPVVAVASTPVPPASVGAAMDKTTLLDDWMTYDSIKQQPASQVIAAAGRGGTGFLEELLALQGGVDNLADKQQVFSAAGGYQQHDLQHVRSDQDVRQQVILLRREQHELARGVRRHHEFMVHKLEERRRHLAIIQSVWVQRDFKHAIEKLVDIYQQGLIFTNTNESSATSGAAKLKSLNTSLAVDVIGIIILRPRLWTLDICQLLLPIINQDLLASGAPSPASPSTAYHEHYAEIGLKALRLILTNFSSVIKSTLESLRESSKLVGIDLSREDRINKCLACYRLLLDSRTILSTHVNNNNNNNQSASAHTNELAGQHRELQSMFSAIFDSLQVLEPHIQARRLQSSGGGGAH